MTPAVVKKSYDALGIDLGMSGIKMAWVRNNGTCVETIATVMKPLPRLENGGFVDNNKEFVTGVISSAVKEMGFKGSKAFLCLSGPNLYMRRLSVVSMSKEELHEAVKWAVKDQIPIELDRVVLDYMVLGESKDIKGTANINVLVAVSENSFVFDCVSIVQNAGLVLEAISLAPFVLNALRPEEPLMAVLDIGSFKAEFTLYNDSMPQFSRQLPGAGNEFTKAITGVLVSDRGRFELTNDQAEQLKLEAGIPEEQGPEIKREISRSQLISMLRPVAERLENELRRSFEYCKSQFKLYTPGKIFLTGGGSLLKNLDRMLARDLGIEFVFLNSRDTVLFDAAVAVTTARAGSINIIPQEIKDARTRKTQAVYLRMVMIVSFIVLLVSYLFMNAHVYNLKRQLRLAASHYNSIQEVFVLKDEIDKYKAILAGIKGSEYDALDILRVISRTVPSSAEIDSMSFSSGNGINIKGTVASARPEVILADFTKAMHAAGIFQDVKIMSLQRDPKKPAIASFIMYCELDED